MTTPTTSIYELFETDADLETQGFWHPINKHISFLLARAGGSNMGFSKAMEKKTRSHRGRGGAFEDDNVDVELATILMQEAFAETVILDWKGVTDKAGKKINYTPAAATKLMKALPDLFGILRDAASKAANFRAEEVKADLGN